MRFAGIHLTCSFVLDTYTMRDLLSQSDLTLVHERDYGSQAYGGEHVMAAAYCKQRIVLLAQRDR